MSGRAMALALLLAWGCCLAADEAPKQRGYVKGPQGTFLYDPGDKEVSELVPLRAVDYATVDALCGPMLSPKGRMSYVPGRGGALVVDRRSVVDRIKAALARFDSQPAVIQIELEFKPPEKEEAAAVDWRGRPLDDGAKRLKDKLPERASVKMSGRQPSKKLGGSVALVTTMSGHHVTLWSGSRRPDPAWLDDFCHADGVELRRRGQRFVPGEGTAAARGVEVLLGATPRLLDNGMVEVEVCPELVFPAGKGGRQRVEVRSLAAKALVQPGRSAPLGTFSEERRGQYGALFGPVSLAGGASCEVLDVSLRVRLIQGGTGKEP